MHFLVVYLSLSEVCIADSCSSINQSNVGRSERHGMSRLQGFTSGRSTLDAILEIHREFSQPLHVAFVDLKAAFDSVN